MYICIYIYTYICIYNVCMHVCMYVSMYACMYICICIYIHVYIYIYIYNCLCLFATCCNMLWEVRTCCHSLPNLLPHVMLSHVATACRYLPVTVH